MPNIREVIVDFAADGVNDSVYPGLLTRNSVARMTNCRLHKQFPTTRHGFKALPLGPDANEFRRLNIQGATFYNPTLGQSQQSFGPDQASIVCSAGGKKFHFSFGANDIVSCSDETHDLAGVADSHLAWIFQAENYIICQDGISDTWIWDGVSPAFTSPGYNTKVPEASRLANSATVGAYAHGRILQVIDGKKIIVGDIIHKGFLSSPKNILETTEQVYFATGSFFSPPSNMGEVLAISILPLRNTQHGHDDVIIHCKYGIFSLKIDHYPRTQWTELAVSKHLLLDTAASGPYAVILYDGDQMFRSRYGIQTIRSAAANADTVGSPQQAISEPINSLMNADYQPLLRFASMSKWVKEHRAFCTTGLWIEGAHRGGRGIASINFNPQGSYSSNSRSWEGLWTMPHGYSRPVQILNALVGDRDRLFVLCTEPSGNVKDGDREWNNSLVEVISDQKFDLMEDGVRKQISSQVVSRFFPKEDLVSVKEFHDGRIVFGDVHGPLEWGVWVRADESDPWTLWTSKKWCGPGDCVGAECLTEGKAYRLVMNLGDFPDSIKNSTQLQALIRWRGYASLQAVRVGLEVSDSDDSPFPDCSGLEEVTELTPCDFDDFEYSLEQPSWTV